MPSDTKTANLSAQPPSSRQSLAGAVDPRLFELEGRIALLKMSVEERSVVAHDQGGLIAQLSQTVQAQALNITRLTEKLDKQADDFKQRDGEMAKKVDHLDKITRVLVGHVFEVEGILKEYLDLKECLGSSSCDGDTSDADSDRDSIHSIIDVDAAAAQADDSDRDSIQSIIDVDAAAAQADEGAAATEVRARALSATSAEAASGVQHADVIHVASSVASKKRRRDEDGGEAEALDLPDATVATRHQSVRRKFRFAAEIGFAALWS
ncbi:hypothetical protein GGF50DRAFT_121380 [Schizophyllum commune]